VLLLDRVIWRFLALHRYVGNVIQEKQRLFVITK